ncbi:hypothetical protein GW17_00036762 [Ensete ventricosum]|nr:hypothetical protein GW17_00036762 [Ensete ventricosum]
MGEWSARTISNVPPFLSDEESKLVGRLRGILSSSRAIRDKIEIWLVEVDLDSSPQEKERVNLEDFSSPTRSRWKDSQRMVASKKTSLSGFQWMGGGIGEDKVGGDRDENAQEKEGP